MRMLNLKLTSSMLSLYALEPIIIHLFPILKDRKNLRVKYYTQNTTRIPIALLVKKFSSLDLVNLAPISPMRFLRWQIKLRYPSAENMDI
mmetsp:Transcript_115364/g.326018  ORF Transcript_115364/g.326018 Transcript_115364/m.326018 type:complete len:90 (-) Transcript_115364:859-1128(-)